MEVNEFILFHLRGTFIQPFRQQYRIEISHNVCEMHYLVSNLISSHVNSVYRLPKLLIRCSDPQAEINEVNEYIKKLVA